MTETALFNPEAEQLVIAAILREPDSYYSINSDKLTEQDFLGIENRRVFKAILEVVAEKGRPDLVMVLEALRLAGHNEETEYVTHLYNYPCSTAQAIEYAKTVRALGVARQLGQAGAKIIEISREKRSDFTSAIYEAERLIRKVADTVPETERSPKPADIIRRLYSAGPTNRIPISFSPSLQNATGGMIPGHFWVIGGFASVGKSAFACNLALDALNSRGKYVALVSAEMTQEQFMIRMLSIKSGVPQRDISANVTIGLRNQEALVAAQRDLERAPLFVYDTLYRMQDIRNEAKRLKEREGLDLLIVDYIQNLHVTGDEVGDARAVAIECQRLAKELDCTVVAFSQVSNAMASQDIAESGKGDYYSFKGHGAIRDAADVALMLRRERRAQSPILKVQIAKNRHGILDEFACRMELSTGRIEEIVVDDEEEDD